jgi:hypothetical protein
VGKGEGRCLDKWRSGETKPYANMDLKFSIGIHGPSNWGAVMTFRIDLFVVALDLSSTQGIHDATSKTKSPSPY